MIAAYRGNNSNNAGKASSTGTTVKQQDQQSGQQDKQHKHKEHSNKNQPILPEVGQYVIDQKNGKKYLRGRLMGKVSSYLLSSVS